MKFSFLLFLVSILSCSLFSQSATLIPGQSSTAPYLGFASDSGLQQYSAGFIRSFNGKADLGLDVSFISDAEVFSISPFYRYFFANSSDVSGVAFSTSLGYNFLTSIDGGSAHIASLSPTIHYRIDTKKVRVVPSFALSYLRNLEFDVDDLFYIAAVDFAFKNSNGFVTFQPNLQFTTDGGSLFSVRLFFQRLR